MRKVIQHVLRWLSIVVLSKYKPKVVAVTGSVGKSSAKEAIFCVLNRAFPGRVRRSVGNLNTEIGLPLTVIGGEDAQRSILLWLKNFARAARLLIFKKVSDYPEILALEMAADKPGDIAYLTSFVYPDVAVVTAIGEMPVHLEFFPERDEYILEKANILKNLKPLGAAILNYDDMAVRELRNNVPTGRERLYYGFGAASDIEVTGLSYNVPNRPEELAAAGMEFSIKDNSSGESADFKINRSLGLPVVYAAAAAAAAGRVLGISLAEVSKALIDFKQPPHRLELLKGVKETIILDDSYNSSPMACEEALSVLSKFKKNRRVAVLGSMRELGVNTEKAHRRLGQKAAKTTRVLFLVGDETVFAREEAEKAGKKLGENLFWFSTAAAASKKVEQVLQPDDVVLIKGSRSVKMETIVNEIKSEARNPKYETNSKV